MEPIPETAEALRELTRHGDDSVAHTLRRIGRFVERIVPDTVAISLALVNEDVTFTLTKGPSSLPRLEATPPRPDTGASDGGADVLDEQRWRRSALATAADGVESTLSLPVLRGGAVVADLSIYASSARAFEGHVDELAAASGAEASAAVTNADLEFSSHHEAVQAPDRVRAQAWWDRAVGALMSQEGLDPDEAEERLTEAARRAGLTHAQLARAVVEVLRHSPGDDTGGGER